MERESQDAPSRHDSMPIKISMCGDVMTGRAIDQILSHPGNPTLHEQWITDARKYVELAERADGPVPKPVDDAYVWGDALAEWDRLAPDVRIANLETSITTSDEHWPGKSVHYRMNPANVGCLAAGRLDFCSLANNHVLDWGRQGLVETLQTLKATGLNFAGAGINRAEASAPLALEVPGKGRVVIFAFGSPTSGIPSAWAAKEDRPGVSYLAELSEAELARIQRQVAQVKRKHDVVLASIHWGVNWGYDVPESFRAFAHQLVDSAGVDVIHGHSSHHALGIEVYQGRLILYGCGDFLDDYEGISGHEEFRSDLGLMYAADVDPRTGRLCRLEMTPTQVRQMRVQRAGAEDTRWLQDMLNRESAKYGTQVDFSDAGTLELKWAPVVP